ncbi:MAG TPA: ABC transporter substrate-binding protein [Phototrophicaceae bacterium]|nr:ABC transporter substrate-binding protein [Phototrophicaceae bacterium]
MSADFKRFSLILALLLLFTVMAVNVAAQDEVAREDTVIFDIDDSAVPNPTNFNYLVPGVNRNQGAHQAMWEPLFVLNYETGEIQPWQGLSFTPNETQDVWTLKLREGIKWSDGVPFTADDVVFTLQTLLDDTTATLTNAANMQQWVDSVKKIDDLTVEFDLKASNPRFQLDYFSVRIWGSLVILPKHVWEGQDPFTFTFYDAEKGWPIGTGPYKLNSANPTQFVWDRDDNWWGAAAGFHALPEPKRLVWQITGSEENKALLMSNHELDSAMNITLGAFEAIQARNPNAIGWYSELPYSWADPCPRQLSFNTETAPWNDANLRKAVSLIVDRNQIIEVAYEGTTTASKTMFVQYGGMETYINAIVEAGMGVSPTSDVPAGQALIEAAGYTKNADGLYEKDGQVLTADFIVDNGTAEYTRTVNVVVEQLRNAGIDATAHPLTGATNGDNMANGTFDASYNWDTCGSVNEPWVSMNTLNTHFYVPIGERASANYIRWNTDGAKAYSAVVDQIGTLPLGDPQIVDLVVEAYKYIYDETPVIPLVQAAKLVPFDTTYWVGWPTAEDNYNHPATWWNSTHQIILNLKKAGS